VVVDEQVKGVYFLFAIELELVRWVAVVFDAYEVHTPRVVVVFLDLLFENPNREIVEISGRGVFFVQADFDVPAVVGGEFGLQELPVAGGKGVGKMFSAFVIFLPFALESLLFQADRIQQARESEILLFYRYVFH
jgi:hypothetical protein